MGVELCARVRQPPHSVTNYIRFVGIPAGLYFGSDKGLKVCGQGDCHAQRLTRLLQAAKEGAS